MCEVKYKKSTLKELKVFIEHAIAMYGEDTQYILSGCYGADGDVIEIIPNADKSITITTDICSG